MSETPEVPLTECPTCGAPVLNVGGHEEWHATEAQRAKAAVNSDLAWRLGGSGM